MITIVEPKDHIARLWGKQQIRESDTYRLMRYVLRVDHEGKVLLHNVVTGQLVVLEQEEADALDKLPSGYDPVMEQLVSGHYLVPETYDEHQQVFGLRNVFRKLEDVNMPKDITHYTILPTTACNARCYYCFEHGARRVTMTEQKAKEVVDFIICHCGDKKDVRISWFGGEPTVASHRINQICNDLRTHGIKFVSDMTTNGYLFDNELVHQAKDLWNLFKVMICVDGTEKNYNEAKAYVNAQDNPYKRVMRNIGLLIEQGVFVTLRMNFDLDNYSDFATLIMEVKERFGSSPFLEVRVHPIVGEYANHSGRVSHADDSWFSEKIVELHTISRDNHLLSRTSSELPYLNYKGCQATVDSSVTITPEGYLVRCPEQFGEDQITGTVSDGITNSSLLMSWKEFSDLKHCHGCVFYPFCVKVERCLSKDKCTFYLDLLYGVQNTAKQFFRDAKGATAS